MSGMFVGACELEMLIHASTSLKEKRFVIKSIKGKVANRFNVSIAEIDHLDKWQRATLGVAIVSNEQQLIRSTFDEIVRLIESSGEAEVIRQSVQVY